MRLQGDLIDYCNAALDGKLDSVSADWEPRCAVGVVLASGGYPSEYKKGLPISGLEQPTTTDSKVFHAGTKIANDTVVTNGGRVLCATALGDNITEAQQNAYQLARSIHWDDMFYRHDIAFRAIEQEQIVKT
jgi:phosphoribosylamine--glycine ligase